MIRSIFVPLDGFQFSEHAIPFASEIARRAGGRLHLARVHNPLPPPHGAAAGFVDEVDLLYKDRENSYLDDVVRRMGNRPSLRVATELLDGATAPALCARAADFDLVVMTTHGRGPLGRLWLGSVADELIRVLPVPLLLLRPQEGPADFRHEPVCKQMVLPLDGTPMAEQILEPALEVGTLLGSSFRLVRVVKPTMVGDYIPPGAIPAGDASQMMTGSLYARLTELQRQLEAEARSYLESVASRLAKRGISVETRLLIDDQPAAGILSQAHTDMIALATHGRRGIRRVLLGSVADKLVRGCSVPLLLFRPKATGPDNS
jgi:nucleotide-binding universal stress UspA family protein